MKDDFPWNSLLFDLREITKLNHWSLNWLPDSPSKLTKTANEDSCNDHPPHSRLAFTKDDRKTFQETAEAEDVSDLHFAFLPLLFHSKGNIGKRGKVTRHWHCHHPEELEILQKEFQYDKERHFLIPTWRIYPVTKLASPVPMCQSAEMMRILMVRVSSVVSSAMVA